MLDSVCVLLFMYLCMCVLDYTCDYAYYTIIVVFEAAYVMSILQYAVNVGEVT